MPKRYGAVVLTALLMSGEESWEIQDECEGAAAQFSGAGDAVPTARVPAEAADQDLFSATDFVDEELDLSQLGGLGVSAVKGTEKYLGFEIVQSLIGTQTTSLLYELRLAQ